MVVRIAVHQNNIPNSAVLPAICKWHQMRNNIQVPHHYTGKIFAADSAWKAGASLEGEQGEQQLP